MIVHDTSMYLLYSTLTLHAFTIYLHWNVGWGSQHSNVGWGRGHWCYRNLSEGFIGDLGALQLFDSSIYPMRRANAKRASLSTGFALELAIRSSNFFNVGCCYRFMGAIFFGGIKIFKGWRCSCIFRFQQGITIPEQETKQSVKLAVKHYFLLSRDASSMS